MAQVNSNNHELKKQYKIIPAAEKEYDGHYNMVELLDTALKLQLS